MKGRVVSRLGLSLAVGAAIALGSVAFAQNVPEQFIVTGKAAEKIQDFTTINAATAQRIAESCEKAATAQGVQISIIVLDKDGNHVYFDLMDGQGLCVGVQQCWRQGCRCAPPCHSLEPI